MQDQHSKQQRHQIRKELVIDRQPSHGIGIEVGWRFHDLCCPDDAPLDLWWGNSKDENALQSVLAEMRSKDYTWAAEVEGTWQRETR